MNACQRSALSIRALFTVLGSLVVVGLAASPAAAQDGWLGLEIRFESGDAAVRAPSGGEALVIESVVPGSPADSAGIQADDRVVEIDGSPASNEELDRLRRDLDPGDSVDLILDRAGERVAVTVTAAEAPADIRRRRMSILLPSRGARRDSVWVDLQLDLDSLQARIEALNRERLDSIRVRMDSIRVQMDSLNEERLAETARQLESSQRALEEARRARERALVLSLDADSLRRSFYIQPFIADSIQALVRAWTDNDSIQSFWRGFVDGDSIQALVEAWTPDFDQFRFYSPFFAGQRTVAGAELADLNPSLARYFDVDAGVLVVDVTERSPAAEGGLEPGDVIVEVNGDEVTSIQDVREAFSRLTFARVWGRDRDTSSEPTVSVTVVREGDRMELELRE